MIDAAEHTGLIGMLVRRFRVRHRFQHADAEDIIGDMALALVLASRQYDAAGGGTFSTYAASCMRPVAEAGGSRLTQRVIRRKKAVKRRGCERIISLILFSEIGPKFESSSYFATEPSADSAAESEDERRALRQTIHHHMRFLDKGKRLVLELRYGLGNYEPMTLQQVGEYMGVTRERVRQLQANAERKLMDLFEGE